MDCRRADELLIDFLYDALEEGARQEFVRHLQECEAHRREVAQHGRLLRAVRAEPREEPDPALDRRVLEEARRTLACPQEAGRRSWWALVFRPSFAAAALLLLLGVGLMVFWRRFPEPPSAPGGEHGPAILPGAPPPVPARSLERRPGTVDELDREELAAAGKPEEKAAPEGGARPSSTEKAGGETDRLSGPSAGAKEAIESREGAPRVAALPRAPRKGSAGGLDGKAKNTVLASGASTAIPESEDAGARGAAGGVAEAKPASAPHPEPPVSDDARSRSAGTLREVEEEARFAQPPPAAPVVAETAQKEDAAGTKKAEARKVAAQTSAAPASEAPRPAEPSPAQPPDRDEEQHGRARLQAAKDKASGEAEELRRCVREESGARAADCRYRLFDALFRAGRCAEAVSVAEQAVAAAPADARAADTLLDAASCLENLGRLERARAFYRRVEKEYPAHANEARRALQRLP